MAANAFDDLPSGIPAPVAANAHNAFDDITPPASSGAGKPPVTAVDRLQAAEGGILRGTAYTAGLIPDTLLNAMSLGQAGLGTAVSAARSSSEQAPVRTPGGLYHYLTSEGIERFSKEPPPAGAKPVTVEHPGQIPSWLQLDQPVSPVGAAITRLMDRSPLTTTQPVRPDDPASRYLSTAASVVPAVASGGGSLASIPSTVAKAAVPAMAGQYVAESKPFGNDTANNAAALLTQALGTAVMPRARGAPVQSKANDAVQAGQEAGYVFPPGTTNPTAGNRLIEGIAGKTSVAQHATVANQPVTNEQGRTAMQVPGGSGAPISDVEIAQAKANFAPGYDNMRGAGQIVVPMDWTQRLTAALKKQSGAARLDPTLADSQLDTTVANLSRLKNFDSSDAMDAIDALRDRSSAAFRAGNSQAGRAYKATSNVIEDAIDSDLSRDPTKANIVPGFRASRQGFAAISDVEENRNPTTGNLNAQKLAAALKGGDYLGPSGAPLRVAAEAAGQAPKAFAEPTSTPGSSHLGFWGSMIGAMELGQHLPLEHGGLELAALPLMYQGARMGARGYALGPGQSRAIQYGPGGVDPRLLTGALTSAPGNLSP